MRTQKNDKKEATSILRCLLLDCMIRKMFVLSLEKRRSLKKSCGLFAIQSFDIVLNSIRHHFCDVAAGLYGLPNHRRTIRINWRIE